MAFKGQSPDVKDSAIITVLVVLKIIYCWLVSGTAIGSFSQTSLAPIFILLESDLTVDAVVFCQ